MTAHQNHEHTTPTQEQPLELNDYSPELIDRYKQLIDQEATPADPNEIIPIGHIDPESYEATILNHAGISETDNLTRAQLLGAGFTFINTIGGGEKPLIATTITLEDGATVDTSQRKLLTGAELAAIIEQQGDSNANEQTRVAMLDFLEAAKGMMSLAPDIKKHLFKEAQSRIIEQGNPDDIAAIGELFRSVMESGDHYVLSYIVDACAAGLPLTKLGNIPIDSYATRSGVLHGAPSPFLDSGFHFDVNDDITIYPDDPTKTRRLNSVVVHLLSRGLNEAGSSTNGSHDQTYITAKEFTELAASLTEDTEIVSAETLQLFAERLVAQAKERTAE